MKNNYTFFNLKSKTHTLSGSSSFVKSFALALAMFVVGIGGVWGQIAMPYTELFTGITAANGFPTVTGGAWTRSGSNTTQPTYITNPGTYNRSGNGDTKFISFRYDASTRYYFVGPFALTAGVTYQSSVLYKADGATGFGPLALTYGTTAAAGTQTNTIASVAANITNTAYATLSGTFIPATTGNYFVAIKCTANGSPWYLSCDNFTMSVLPGCSGTPNTGAAAISSASVCASTSFNLSATGLSSGAGLTYQWQSSPNNSTWTNITSATATTYSTSIASGVMYYRIQTRCTASGITSNSSSISATAVSCINMSTGSTTLTGNTNFYDNGGPSADYASSQTLTYTVYPSSCNNVRAVFSSIATEACCDNLKIYNGNSAAETLIGTYTTTSPGTITSSAVDGSLTFVFTSDGSITAAGWAATLSNIAVSAGPAQPSSIVGTLNPEVGATETYSVTNVSGVSYTWSFPAGWVVNSGEGTNSVSVTVGSTNGTISVTPSKCSINGTARTATSTIPNYRWKYISSSLGAATWTGGEVRNVDITIKNTGVGTWNTGVTTNACVRWDSDNSNAAFSPWTDYHSRVTTGTVSPGSQVTCTLPIEAKNATSGPTYSTNLADGTYYLAFDLVNEGSCWFGGPAGGTGPCTAGNTPWYSSVQTVSTVPTLSCSALTAFGNVCTNATSTNSFTISGVNLTNNVSVGSVTGYTYSTTSNGTYTSTLTLTPSSGSLNQIVYVKFTPTAATAYSGSISVTSTGATGQSVSVSGTGILIPSANAGADFALCSGQTIALSATTNATGPTLSGTASSGAVTASGTDNANPTATYTFTGLPAGAVINGITVNITSAGGGNCPGWYSVTTRLNGVQQGVAGCAASTIYTNLNGQDANGLVVAVRGQDNDAYGDAMTITYTVTLNYTYVGSPTYAWSPATGLSASNILNPTCSTTSTETYTLTVTGGNGCSASDQVVATVPGAAPSTPTASVSGSSTINVGGTTTLTSSAGANTLWYEAASGGSSVGSGDNFTTPVQCTSGTTTYYAENNNGTCASASRTAVSFTVRPMVVSNPANGLICQAGGSVTLSTQLTGGSAITWSPATALSATSGASTIASPTATTVYTMSATVASCPGSVSAQQTVGVIDAVAFTPTSSPASVCAGNPAALASNLNTTNFSASCITASNSLRTAPGNAVTLVSNNALTASGSLPSGVTVNSTTNLDDNFWSGVPIGFTYNYFGDNATTVFIGTNGTVVVNVPTAAGSTQFNFTGGFPNSANPAATVAVCARDLRWDQNASGSIKYWTEGIAPTRKFIIQYAGGVPYSGDYLGRQDAELVLNETTGIVEIYVIRATNNGSTNANSQNKYIGLQDKLKTTGATSPNCSTDATNYWNGVTDQITTANGQAWKFIPGADYTFQWATAGANIGSATATTYTTPNLSTPGTVTYSVAATNPNTQCTTTQSVSITVNALPSAPNSSGNVTACSTAGNQSLTVSTGAGETADWFAASTGGTVLASGDNVLSYSTATANTYYAEAQNTTTGCSSASRTVVTLTVNNSPAAPTVTTPVTYCQGATATTLTATATGANTLNWYSAAPSYPAVTGATALGSAPTPSTAASGTTNYYVSQSSSANSCESELALVAVTVNVTPSQPTGVAGNRCGTGTVELGVETSQNGTMNWYTDPALTTLATNGSYANCTNATTCTTTWTTPSISETTTFYVTKTNVAGCQGPAAAVIATVNPIITASVSNSASSTSACGGGSITFTATPTNGGTPTYQWYLNSASVSGETNATYTLATPTDADVIYVEMTPSAQNCLASNAATSSNTVTLTSTAATPTVSIQSTASTAICPGTSVTFSVNASANMGATPTYQWNLNGSAISGATNATLVNTTLTNNDQVTLTMTSSLGGSCVTQQTATSSAVATTVNAATAISSQPTAAAACLGGSQNFTVSATGTGALTYQWKKNGSNVTANATATTATLTLSGIAAGDAADYTVDVTGTCGSVLSSSAALTINTATAISAQPSAVTQCAGTTANFSVTGSGQGTLSYQWRKDGSALNGETNSTLAVTNIATINAGQYSVIVTAGCGNVTSSNAQMTVNASTAISTQPAASTLCAGNTANFSVTAAGTGALSYQWKRDGNNVGTNSSSLAVSNSQAENAGTYTVDVTGTCGTITSNNALLTVNPLTTISTQPVATSGCEGQNTTFTVVAAGTGVLSYQWKFGGVNISGATTASFNIPSTTSADDGSYLVVVTGGCGTAVNSNTVALNVYASPSTALITTADITDGTLCGKNTVAVVANSPGAESVGSWSVVGGADITPANASATSTTFTAANSELGGAAKKLVWSHTRETSGNFCYTRDTLTVDFKQPSTTGTTASFTENCYLWCGLTDANWSTSSNWYKHTGNNASGRWEKVTTGEPGISSNVFVLNNANDVCVNTSNIPTLGNGEVTNNVFNAQGAELNLSNGNITLTGNFTNNGTINPGTGTVTFNGTGAQEIRGSGAIANLNNVIVNKASGTLTLEQPTRINGNLTVSNGNIVTTNTNILEIGSSVSSTGSVTWTAGSILGPIKRWFANSANSTTESGIFPVGTATHNRNAIINFTSNSAGGYIIVNFISGLPTATENPFNLPISYFANGSTNYIQNADATGYWEITPYNAGGTAYGAMDSREYSISLRINNTGALIANPVTANPPGMRLLKAKGYANGSHDPFTIANANATVTAIGGSQTDFNVTCTNISGFSFFGMGGDNETPLPVELLSFTGFCGENQTTINWKTASEFNSSYYLVEKSTDGENWREVNNQPAAGFSTEELSYQFIDVAYIDAAYYRLTQVDENGEMKVYDPISVGCNENGNYIKTYPNPSDASFQVVVNNKSLIGKATIKMIDTKGTVVSMKEVQVEEGTNLFYLNENMAPGIYYISISNGNISTEVVKHSVR